MALTKTQLKEILSSAGVSAENAEVAIGKIMDGHIASVNALREERDELKKDVDEYKAKAQKLEGVQKELSELKAKGQITNDTRLVYLKDEVDTVLDEKDKTIADAVKIMKEQEHEISEKDKEIEELNDEIHKLKRALINARHEVSRARGKKSSTKKYIAKYSMRQND